MTLREEAIEQFRRSVQEFSVRELKNIEYHLRHGTRVLAGRFGGMYYAPGAG